MGVDSHSRMCQLDIRKLVFVIIPVAAIVLMVQFVSVPYGNVLLSIFPPEKFPLLVQTEDSPANSSPEAEIVFAISTNSPGLELDIEGVGNVREPVHDLPSENVSFEDVEKETNITLERILAPALPPVGLSNILAPLDGPSDNSAVSADANISSLGEQATNMKSQHNTTEILENNRDTLHNNVTFTLQNNGRGTSRIEQNTTTNSVQMELPSTPVKSLSDMYLLLLKSHNSSHSMIPKWPSERDMEVFSAKAQIGNPPIMKKDKQLYAPLFRNISTFLSSYELMERTLKVYSYKEGEQPIFHRPETKGIYASEGWFMKQMEGNKQFSVNDPTKAHLFYLPFSTRRLEQFLYVPDSHTHKNLVAYLKSYLDLISAKYPFWNRTDGADHFLVGCHDWTPAETRQYMNNCIRALCNADAGDDFAIGKDVSLPETMVRQAKDPLRDLGGKPVSERQILAFFAGSSMHGYLRPILLKYWENKDPDMQIYGHMGHGNKNKASYVQKMKNSKYCICAKGYEVNSPRVVEAIFYECVPVIISDNFVPPFFEFLNWEAFAIFVPEKDIPNLKNILLSISPEKYLKLQMNVRRVQQHFLWHTKPVKYDIFHMILHSVWYSRVYQVNVG